MRTFLSQSNQYNAPIVANPNSLAMVLSSSSASDTQGVNLWADGTINNYTLTGKLEQATGAWALLTRVELASVSVGTITLRRPGTKATGTITVGSNPTDGQQYIIGVTGNTRTYTFKDGEKSQVICVADVANSLHGKYFDIYDGPFAVRVWFNTSGIPGSGFPATPAGGRKLEVTITTGDADTAVATALSAALDADSAFRASVSTATVTVFNAKSIINTTNASDSGSTGFTISTLIAGPDSANNVLVGKTMYASLRNLAEAINDSQPTGGRYGTGTAVNALLTAWADSGHTDASLNGSSEDVIYLQDVLGCSRRLSWTRTEPAAFTTVLPAGGIDGDMVCEIAPGSYGAGADVTLNSTDEINVSQSSTPTFDPIEVFGRHSRLYFQNEGPGDVTAEIRGGPDIDHLVDIETLSVPFDTGVVLPSATIPPCQVVQVQFSAVTTDDCAVYAALVY